jgi:cell fate regulator YaaT (PSP1 superfamily)
MLTEAQEKFLLDNKEVFQKIIPFQKEILEREARKTRIDTFGRQLNKKDDSEEIAKRKKIKALLEKMTLGDIEKFNKLMNDIKDAADVSDSERIV